MIKRFLIKTLCLILCMSFCASAETIYNIALNAENATVAVKGYLGEEKADTNIKICIERKNGTVYSCTAKTDSRGYYYHTLNFDKNLYDCSVYIDCGNGEKIPVELVGNSFSKNISATKLYDGNVIWVEGNVDPKNAGKYVNILMIEKEVLPEDSFETESLGHIGYAVVDSDGYYSYKFTFEGDIENYRLLTKIGENCIINSEIAVINDSSMEISLNLKAHNGKSFSLSENSEAQLNTFVINKFNEGKKVNLFIAFYNSKNMLTDIQTKMDYEIPFNLEGVKLIEELTDFIPSGTEEIKLMVWENDSMKPLGEKSEYTYSDSCGKEFFVSPYGNDFNLGTIEKPLKSLRGARNAVRLYKESNGLPTGGINVYFRGGTYPVTDRVDFTEKDSGTEDCHITYQSYNGEEVVFSGGIEISGADFAKVTDSYILGRLPDATENNIYCVDLKDYGIYEYGDNNRYGGGLTSKIPNVEVFFNDEPMVTARYPDIASGEQKYLNVDTVIEEGSTENPSKFTYTDEAIESATDYSDVIIEGWFTNGYDYEGVEIGTVDKENNIVTFKEHNQRGVAENNRYCITNFLEALDKENEYYIDRKTGMLYLYPVSDIVSATVGLSIYGNAVTDSFIKTNDASYINFKDFNFELSRTNGIVIYGGRNIAVDNCVIRNIGLTGVIIGSEIRLKQYETMNGFDCNAPTTFYNKDYKKAYNHGVVDSVIYNTGEGAVKVSGGDRINLIPANHYIENCSFYDCNRFEKDIPLVYLYGMGLRISNCDLYNSACNAILMGGNDIIIEYNDIYNCANDSTDVGMIYSCTYGAEIQAGSEIRYNYFHDIPNVMTPEHDGSHDKKVAMRVGIYNDYCDPFLDVHHNVFENMPMGIVNGGGYENNWTDNVFMNVYIPMYTQWNNNLDYHITENGVDKMFYALSTSEYRMLDVDSGVWKRKYPKVSEAKAKMLERGLEASYPSSTVSDNVAIFTSWDTIFNGYYYLINTNNYINKIVSRKYFKNEDQAKYMTITNNTYTMNDIYEQSVLKKNIDLTKIGVQ